MIRALAFIFTFVVAASAFIGIQLKQLQTSQITINEPTLYQIKAGTGVNAMCHAFQKNNWVKDCFWLKVYAKINPEMVKLKQGMYLIEQKPLLAMISDMNNGRDHQFPFTILEGSTFKQVLSDFKNAKYLEQVSDIALKNALKDIGIKQDNPEGWFYPDTYFYSAGDSQLDILKRAYQKMVSTLDSSWQTRDKAVPLKTKYDALILASIIEKESGHNAERDLIASVFVNRINKGMRLQTDPTVIYGLGDEYQGDIKSEHLRRHTPYNTYRINGLPPTPIAMPSEQAIYATLNPRYSDFYYFVASGGGEHHFSKTLAEHNAAVRKYLLNK
ncbi:endolytic transglycosylase MltG [Pseudoalteromonas sp. SSM20]|uniref:endolytic transglycosylase MltG n=1 Tax=Pseudoalteromonas sp. SSM20 TaxID=3139394 RepID=UPI003BACBAEE